VNEYYRPNHIFSDENSISQGGSLSISHEVQYKNNQSFLNLKITFNLSQRSLVEGIPRHYHILLFCCAHHMSSKPLEAQPAKGQRKGGVCSTSP